MNAVATTFPLNGSLAGRRWHSATLVAVTVLASYAHFYVVQPNALFYRGPLIWFDRLFDLLLVGGLLGLAFCVGRACERILKLEFDNLAEELSYSIMLGVGLLGLAIFGFAVIGWLRPLPITLLLVTCSVLLRKEAAHLYRRLSDAFTRHVVEGQGRILLGAFLLMALLLLGRAWVPPFTPDETIYHLPVAEAFVAQGRIFPVLDNFSGNLPFLIHMFYAVCLMAKSDIAARVLSLAFAFVTALGLYGFCARFFTRQVAWLSVFIFFASSMVTEHAVTARVDVTLAGMLFMATGALMIYLDSPPGRGWLIASGILAGSAIGIKYNAGLWICGLLVLLIVQGRRDGVSFSALGKQAALFSATVFLLAAPWLIKNAVWFHNPIYPFLTGEVKAIENNQPLYFTENDLAKIAQHVTTAQAQDPKLAALLEQELAAKAGKRLQRNPLKVWEYFTKPNNFNMADDALSPNYLFLFIPFLLLAWRSKWILWLLGLSTAYFLLTIKFTWLARYQLPIYPALTIVSAYALYAMGERLRQWFQAGRWLSPLVVTAVLVWVLTLSCREAFAQKDWQFISGALSRHEFLMAARGDYRMINFMNTELPVGNRILMIGAQQSYGLNHPHLADGGWSAMEWRRLLAQSDTLEQVHEKLKQNGVLYVAYHPNLFGFIANMGEKGSGPSGDTASELFVKGKASGIAPPDYYKQFQNWLTFESYRQQYLEPIYGREGLYGFKVFRLR